jgi:hypothetical protein
MLLLLLGHFVFLTRITAVLLYFIFKLNIHIPAHVLYTPAFAFF